MSCVPEGSDSGRCGGGKKTFVWQTGQTDLLKMDVFLHNFMKTDFKTL